MTILTVTYLSDYGLPVKIFLGLAGHDVRLTCCYLRQCVLQAVIVSVTIIFRAGWAVYLHALSPISWAEARGLTVKGAATLSAELLPQPRDRLSTDPYGSTKTLRPLQHTSRCHG